MILTRNYESALLGRRTAAFADSRISRSQIEMDALAVTFSHEASNFSNLVSMTGAAFSYRLLRTGLLTMNAGRYLASIGGLAAEVTSYRAATSFFAKAPLSPSEAVFNPEGWFGTFLNFSVLKAGALLASGQNAFLIHSFQASSMVAANHIAHSFGFVPHPEGTLLQQLLHAESTNLAMMGGMSLLGKFTGQRLSHIERAMDLRQQVLLQSNSTRTFGARAALNSSMSAEMPTSRVVKGLREMPRLLRRLLLGEFPHALSAEYGGDGNFAILGGGLGQSSTMNEANYFSLHHEFLAREHVVLGVHESCSYSLFRPKGSPLVSIENIHGEWVTLAEEAWAPLEANQRFALGEVFSYVREGLRQVSIPLKTLVLSADPYLNLYTWSPETPYQNFRNRRVELAHRIQEAYARTLQFESHPLQIDFLEWIRTNLREVLENDKLNPELPGRTRPYLFAYLETLQGALRTAYRWNDLERAKSLEDLLDGLLDASKTPLEALALNEILRAYPKHVNDASIPLPQQIQAALAARMKIVLENFPPRFRELKEASEALISLRRPRCEEDITLQFDDGRHLLPFADWWMLPDAGFESFLDANPLAGNGIIYLLGVAGGKLPLQLARRGHSSVSLDLSENAIERLESVGRLFPSSSEPRIEGKVADATLETFEAAKLIAVNVWEFLAPSEKVRLAEHLRSALAPNGKLYFSFSLSKGPRYDFMRRQAWQIGAWEVSPGTFRSERISPNGERLSGDKHYYSREEIQSELIELGFNPLEYEIVFREQPVDSEGFVQASVEITRHP